MLPYINSSALRAIHEERVREAQRPVPEWVGIAGLRRPRKAHDGGVRQRLRSSLAHALLHLAARLAPTSA